MRARLALLVWVLAAVAGPGAGYAQTGPVVDPGLAQVAPSAVLTLDQDRMFRSSAIGLRVLAEIEAQSRALSSENRAIEAALSAEEQALTTKRASLPPAEFRALADDFDARVVATRKAQDDKLAALTARRDAERQAFYQAAAAILGELVQEAGAVAILDSRAVLLSADRIDITDEAIARIDARLGSGAAAAAPKDGATGTPGSPGGN